MTGWRTLGRYAAILAVAGFLLALAFPRTDWSLTPWLVVTPLLIVALLTPPRVAFGWGLLYGVVFFLVLLRWLNFTFRVYSNIPGPLVFLPTVLLAAYCAFWIGGVAWAVSRVAARRSVTWALAVAPFFPGFGKQDHEPLLHREHARPVAGGAVDLLQVAQQARKHFARRGRLQEQAQRHVEIADQALLAAVGRQALIELLARQRMTAERIDHHLALRQAQLGACDPGPLTIHRCVRGAVVVGEADTFGHRLSRLLG